MKILTNLIFILIFSLTTFAQSNRDKIKILKIAYITEKLDLSEKEAQKFWQIYNTFEEQYYKSKLEANDAKKKIDFETISEEQAKQILKDNRLKDNQRQAMENDYFNNLLKTIPAKKIILLRKIEDDFKRKMFDEYKRRGRN